MEAKINQKTTKLFDLSGTQAVVLLAFNGLSASAPTLSFEQLIEVTGLDAPELKKQLISLSMLEHQVLQLQDDSQPIKMTENADKTAKQSLMMSKKKSIKKAITKTDKFSVNRQFKSKMRRIQINAIQKKETRQDSDIVHDKVLQDRKYQVDAAIVKTMKGRKTLKHNDLITEVIRLTRFPCEMEYIGVRIKHLIEGEYMEIDRNDERLYHYKA